MNKLITFLTLLLLAVAVGSNNAATPATSNKSVNVDKKSSTSASSASFKQCSRPHSKMVREYFVRVLLPIFQRHGVPVPEKCPFSPLYDLYHFHENNKTKLDSNIWKCEICGKKFMEEKYLDKHFDLRHSDSLQKSKEGVCLANYCRIFRCDVLMNPSLVSAGLKSCNEATMSSLKSRCTSQLELCIPRGGVPYSTQNKLTVELRESLCSYLTCARFHELPAYMSTGPSFLVIFCIVVFVGLCIIGYGVINHTDLIFDESYDAIPSQMADKSSRSDSLSSSSSQEEKKECPLGCCKKHKCPNNKQETSSPLLHLKSPPTTSTNLRHRHSHACH